MNLEITLISFLGDLLSVFVLCLISFCGNYISQSLDINTNPKIVIGVLIFVVCIKYILSIPNLMRRSAMEDYNSSKYIMHPVPGSMVVVVVGTVLFHISIVIYGAPLFEKVAETFYLSCYLSCTTILPCCCTLGPDMSTWYRVIFKNNPNTSDDIRVRLTTICGVIGAWLGAFPIPLDWDRDWQVWPISCVMGTTLGYCTGLMLAPLYTYITQRQSDKLKLG